MRRLSSAVLAATLSMGLFPGSSSALEPLSAESLQETLTELIATHPTAKRTNVALKVTDLETGEVLFDQNSDKLFTPASNLKIYTSAAALDLLGPGTKPLTCVVPLTIQASSEAKHYLLIDSEADAMLSTKELANLADQTTEMIRDGQFDAGAVHVTTWSSLPDKGPGWMWDDEPDYYNMTVTKTMLDFNTLEVEVSPGEPGGPAVVTISPPSMYPSVDNRARTREGSTGIRITREPFTDTIIVTGSIAPNADVVRDRITMHDPHRWVGAVFTQMLKERGIENANHNPPFVLPDTTKLKYEKSGIPVSEGDSIAEAVKHFLKVSENAVGEMLLLTLSEKFGEGDKVSWPSGAKAISDWLVEKAGLEKGSFRLVDGSGLSRYNLISADSSIRLLTYMKNQSPHFEPFFDGLPIYKVDFGLGQDEQGHFSGKWNGTPLAEFDAERVFAKPGGMSGVSTISGYVQTLDGRWLAFSLLGNGYIGSSAPVRDLRNKVWAELVRYQAAEAVVPAE